VKQPASSFYLLKTSGHPVRCSKLNYRLPVQTTRKPQAGDSGEAMLLASYNIGEH